MRKTLRVIALTLAMILTMGLCVYAGTQWENIWVEMNSVNLKVDGTKVDADNILYNGTTYVPLRRTAEILGKEVGWNEESNTALINSKFGTKEINSFNLIKLTSSMKILIDTHTAVVDLMLCYSSSVTLYNEYLNNGSSRIEHKNYYIEGINDAVQVYENLKEEDFPKLENYCKDTNLDISLLPTMKKNVEDCISSFNNFYKNLDLYNTSKNKDYINEAHQDLEKIHNLLESALSKVSTMREKCLIALLDMA